MANVYQFPSDLSDSTDYGHMMVFSAYTPESARLAAAQRRVASAFNSLDPALRTPWFGPNAGTPITMPTMSREILDQIFLFVPGGEQTALSWQQKHEYQDVKMAGLATGMGAGILGAISDIDPGTISKAGQVAGGIFRTQINPYVEVLFRGTDLRSFMFSFMFAPQSSTDALQLYGSGNGDGSGILNRFRYHAAPEFSGGGDGVFFKSPSEWEIEFYYKEGSGPQKGSWSPNKNIPKIAKGVLTRVDVDYNPGTEFSSFENGAPTTARLEMNFVEMEIIDKTRILKGF